MEVVVIATSNGGGLLEHRMKCAHAPERPIWRRPSIRFLGPRRIGLVRSPCSSCCARNCAENLRRPPAVGYPPCCSVRCSRHCSVALLVSLAVRHSQDQDNKTGRRWPSSTVNGHRICSAICASTASTPSPRISTTPRPASGASAALIAWCSSIPGNYRRANWPLPGCPRAGTALQ